jgi:hypothetical protein
MPATSPCARRRSAGRRYAGLSPMALRRPPIAHITPSSIRPASWACSLASPRRCTCVSQRRALRQDAALDPLLRKLGAGVELLGAPRCAQGDELGGVMSPPAKASCVSRLSADPRITLVCAGSVAGCAWIRVCKSPKRARSCAVLACRSRALSVSTWPDAVGLGGGPAPWGMGSPAERGRACSGNGNGNGNGNGEFRPIDD